MIWTPEVGEVLQLRTEVGNEHDEHGPRDNNSLRSMSTLIMGRYNLKDVKLIGYHNKDAKLILMLI